MTIPSYIQKLFWAKVDKTTNPNGCWVWLAYRHKAGYGQYRFNGKNYLAHRLAYVMEHGSIPEGKQLHHKCENKPCVNPSHLTPVTHQQNLERAAVRGKFCGKGHEFTEKNTYIRPGTGYRQCRECHRLDSRRYDKRWR